MINRAVATIIWLGTTGLILTMVVACQSTPAPSIIGTVEITSLERPYRIAVDSATGVAYVLSPDNTISVLYGAHLSDTIHFPQKTVNLSGPIIVQPHSGQVYVFDSGDHMIRVIERDGTFATMQDASFSFREAVFNPITGYVYVINLWDRKENDKAIGGSVLVITDTRVIARVPVGRSPLSLGVDPLDGLMYVGDYPEKPEDYKQLLTVISGTQVIATSDMGQKPVGGGVSAIVIDPRTGQVFTYMNQRLFALRDLKPIRERHFDKPALQIMFNPVNGWLYAMMIKDQVLVLDTNLNIVGSISIQSKHPSSGNRSMAIDPVRGYVYVGRIEDDTLTVIRDTQVITTLQVGWDVTDIGIDPCTGMVYTVNNMSSSVTVVGFPKETK